MDEFKINVNQRFIDAIKSLAKADIIKNDKDFSVKLGVQPQIITDIKANRRSLTIEIIRDLLVIFGVNPYWILTGNGEKFIINDKNTEFLASNLAGNLASNQYLQNKTTQILREPQEAYITEEINNLKKEMEELRKAIHLQTRTITALEGAVEAYKEVEKLRKQQEEAIRQLKDRSNTA